MGYFGYFSGRKRILSSGDYFMATIMLLYFEKMLHNINTLKVIVMPKYFTV